MTIRDQINSAIDGIRDKYGADILIYSGEITRHGAALVAQELKKREGDNLLFILCTVGGDSHAAYKIARACQLAYSTVPDGYKSEKDPRIKLYVPTFCKSSGTIIALGADDLMMDDSAELGPIDIQYRKPEEVGEMTSTLTPLQTMQSLQREATKLFSETFSSLRFDEGMSFSTKMASELARDLTGAIMSPISGQIDPYRLAETERLLKISSEYGRRLSDKIENLQTGALSKLLADYPSHSFVIDREEAKTLFQSVDSPSAIVSHLGKVLSFLYIGRADLDPPFVRMIEPIEDDGDGEGSEEARDTSSSGEQPEGNDSDS